jgi:hypothetical protein
MTAKSAAELGKITLFVAHFERPVDKLWINPAE